MKPGHNSTDTYRDLIVRAEAFFLRMYPAYGADNPAARSPGVTRWLADLEEARMWEAIENYQALELECGQTVEPETVHCRFCGALVDEEGCSNGECEAVN
jgi:hypothetical protein